MKILTVCTGYSSHEHFVLDDAKADEAYAKMQSAMSEYKEYGNDKDKTVSVDLGPSQVTYRLAALAMVDLADCAAGEATIIEREVWMKTVRAKAAARLAPAAS